MRKLAIAALSFSAAVFLANYILPVGALPLLASVCAIGALALYSLRGKWLHGVILALFGLSLGLGCFYVHYRQTTECALALDGDTMELTAELLEAPREYERYSRASVQLRMKGLPRFRVLVYDYNGMLADCEPGELLRFEAKLRMADKLFGESYDYYKTQGIYLKGNIRSEISRASEISDLSLIPMKISGRLSSVITELFPEDTRSFMQGLLLGDKTELYEDVSLYAAMSRAGFMHVVAVSGMHVSFLVAFLQLLLGRGRKSSLFCIALVWLFVLVTGSSPSAVRAGVMQSFLLFAPVVNRENDSLTSLSAALALLLLLNPYAARSVSLQLSFTAVAGILCLNDRIYEPLMERVPEGRMQNLLRGPVSILTCSLGVMIFTVPLMAVHFGYVSLLSPLTNVLGLWAVSLSFCGGIAACLAAFLFRPLAALLVWPVAWAVRYIAWLVRLISSASFAVVYFRHWSYILWIVLSYLCFFGFLVTKLSFWRKLLYPSIASLLCLVLTANICYQYYRSGAGTIGVLDVGQGQCITVLSGDATWMIDCGGLGSLDDAGETAGAYLNARGRRRVDTLVLTHLDSDHVNGIPMLMELVEVRQIILPENPEHENGMLEDILVAAARHGTELLYLGEDRVWEQGSLRVSLFAPDAADTGNDYGISALVSLGEYDMLVTGDSSGKRELALLEQHPLHDVELLVVGHHGSKYSNTEELLSSIGAKSAVISVGYNNYGHPAEETLERLRRLGYDEIRRTDEDGTVEIRIG